LNTLCMLYQLRIMLSEAYAEKCAQALAQIQAFIPFEDSETKGLSQRKTTRRKIRSTRLGQAMEFQVESGVNEAGKRIVPADFRKFAPKGSEFSFDTIWDVTSMRLLKNMQRSEVQQALTFPISTGSISNLSQKGLAYFRACHESAIPELKKFFCLKGKPFIWQMDGTNEGGKSTLFQVRESSGGIVLWTKNIPTENQADIELILRKMEAEFGRPDVIISDMSGKGIKAVENLWGESVSLFICQFHFLRDIGKDLLMEQHEALRKSISASKISTGLNSLRKSFFAQIDSIAELSEKAEADLLKIVELIDWICDYKSELKGEGTPFDLQWKHYYERCRKAFKQLEQIFSTNDREHTPESTKALGQLRATLSKLIVNKSATRRYRALMENQRIFMEIRKFFWDDIEDKSAPLSKNSKADKGESAPDDSKLQRDIQGMADKLQILSDQAKGANISRYIKAKKQLKKYKHQLGNYFQFEGELHPLPRTNNLCEVGFRDTKSQMRRTTGKKNLVRILDSTSAEIMLLQNLRNEDYSRIVFKGKAIHEAFAEIPEETVKEIIKEMGTPTQKRVISPAIKQGNFMQNNKAHFLKVAI